MQWCRYVCWVFFGFGLLVACGPGDQLFSDVPTLEFVEFRPSIVADSGFTSSPFQMLLKFTDGDGDLGYKDQNSTDTASIPNDLFVRLNRVIERDTLDYFGYNLPYLTPDPGKIKNPSIQGTITVDFTIPLSLSNPALDTVEFVTFNVFITDRARNRSNIVRTPPLKLVRAY
jgi:hypothetical protein